MFGRQDVEGQSAPEAIVEEMDQEDAQLRRARKCVQYGIESRNDVDFLVRVLRGFLVRV